MNIYYWFERVRTRYFSTGRGGKRGGEGWERKGVLLNQRWCLTLYLGQSMHLL